MMNLRKKAGNNKGFSLVELIIVIAILAILVGVLAPQYIKYVEKSRKSTDVSNIDNFVSAIKVTAADTDYATNLNGKTYIITIASTATSPAKTTTVSLGTAGTATTDLNAAFEEALGAKWADTKLKSKSWGATEIKATVVIDANGSVTATYTPTSVADALK